MRQAPSEELLRPTRPSRRGETAPTLRAGGTVPTSRRIMSHSTLGEDLWSSTRMGTGSFDERSHRRFGRFGLAFAIGRYGVPYARSSTGVSFLAVILSLARRAPSAHGTLPRWSSDSKQLGVAGIGAVAGSWPVLLSSSPAVSRAPGCLVTARSSLIRHQPARRWRRS